MTGATLRPRMDELRRRYLVQYIEQSFPPSELVVRSFRGIRSEMLCVSPFWSSARQCMRLSNYSKSPGDSKSKSEWHLKCSFDSIGLTLANALGGGK